MYRPSFIAFSKSSGVANSFGSIREWLCMPTRILCRAATGATARRSEFDDAVITGAPSALAISKPRSISASVKSSWKLML